MNKINKEYNKFHLEMKECSTMRIEGLGSAMEIALPWLSKKAAKSLLGNRDVIVDEYTEW